MDGGSKQPAPLPPPTTPARRKCSSCPSLMSEKLIHLDPHSRCRKCRRQICSEKVTCEDCINVDPEVRRKLFVIENKLQQKVDSRIRRSKGNESDSSTTSNRSLDRNYRKTSLFALQVMFLRLGRQVLMWCLVSILTL